MRKNIKDKILELISTMYDAHSEVDVMIIEKNYEGIYLILEDCQSAAIQIGECIENSEGENFVTIKYLEEYCELLYEVATNISNGRYENVKETLDLLLNTIINSINSDIKCKWEIVFLPYKVSMWDSLESVWKAANDDDDFDVYVIPIPYYDRNPDYTLGEYHYEGDIFPNYVSVTHYEKYDFNIHKPDAIFIHNPYDMGNYVTSVDPRFYSFILKKYTDLLVYIPYFLFPKEPQVHLIDTCALGYIDCAFVQNEKVKQAYINQSKVVQNVKLADNIFKIGSPKIDKMYEICKNGIQISDTWKRMAGNKKKVFMNTNISLILNNNDRFIDNLKRIFGIFKSRKDVFVIWREHPLTYETLKSMRPEMINEYNELKLRFINDGLGVIDNNAETYEAIYFSDCYFGSGGSLAPIYAVTGKPMLLTAYKYPENIICKQATLSMLLDQAEKSMYFSERYENFLNLFLDNINVLEKYKDKRLGFLSEIVENADGTSGKKILFKVKSMLQNVKTCKGMGKYE